MWPLQKEKSSLTRENDAVWDLERWALKTLQSLEFPITSAKHAQRFDASHRRTELSSTRVPLHGMLVSISVTFGRNLFVPTQGRVSRGYS